MPWKFLPDVALADIAFEVTATSEKDLFVEAGKALEDVMVNLKTIKKKKSVSIMLEAENLEMLLYDWMSELIYLKDTDGFLFSDFDVTLEKKEKYIIHATGHGEVINRKTHDLRNDVKAVTMHLFEVKKQGKTWKAKVVVDV